jgi:hypothetical protein
MTPKLLEAWPVDEPGADLCDRVMAQVEARRARTGTRRRAGIAAVAALAAAAGVAAAWWWPRMGTATATHRLEVALGHEGVGVLEPGARIAWRGRRVTQAGGNVFYRVERGGRFVIAVPSGEVEVLGTCLRVVVDDAAGRPFHVAVSEGRVRVRRGGEAIELAAGEAAVADEGGVRREAHPELTARGSAGRLATGVQALAARAGAPDTGNKVADEAIADAMRAFAQATTDEVTPKMLTLMYKSGNYEAAKNLAERTIESQPPGGVARCGALGTSALVSLALHERDEAAALARQIGEECPDDPAAQRDRAHITLAIDPEARARREAELRTSNDGAEIASHGRFLVGQKAFGDAAAWAREALARGDLAAGDACDLRLTMVLAAQKLEGRPAAARELGAFDAACASEAASGWLKARRRTVGEWVE